MLMTKSDQLPGNFIMLFTDGSVDVKTGIGYGAYLVVTNADVPPEDVKKQVQLRRFENTSSTRLELETLLWALSHISAREVTIEIYTDSQNIIRLPDRRKRLEQGDYHSKNNRLIKNQDLYREFFRITDLLNYKLIKATGHQPSHHKDAVHRLFALVDKASRKALRKNSTDGMF